MSTLTLLFTSAAAVGTGVAAVTCRRAARQMAETSMRVTELLAGPPVQSPRCPTCAAPLQRAVRPFQGQTHYCARCELWMVVAGA